ncbi:GNAT family N-acetyltransferase [Thalassotalea castellviae]|uniref:GNAT family N-acetyltransferase n=1 Tax=Thalassotalea castellviae TaxID=3075612 RepID=A0ABU2ZXV4_9GAMM|nr:GNAT family N-acetyltransferase [Thalassotalea sp. W431]MDT0602463.1 GNAT family N-acetyltransferase [Thalassotalea sp. W431]
MSTSHHWQVKTFKQLTLDELYDALKLRIDVFVVEQTCFYPDLDNLDRHPETRHIFLYSDQGEMIAYSRVLAKGVSYQTHPAIGRVIIAEQARGNGIAHQLIEKSLDVCAEFFPKQGVKISAQEHLEQFYNRHGFNKCSEMYLEDGIAHISMTKTA